MKSKNKKKGGNKSNNPLYTIVGGIMVFFMLYFLSKLLEKLTLTSDDYQIIPSDDTNHNTPQINQRTPPKTDVTIEPVDGPRRRLFSDDS